MSGACVRRLRLTRQDRWQIAKRGSLDTRQRSCAASASHGSRNKPMRRSEADRSMRKRGPAPHRPRAEVTRTVWMRICPSHQSLAACCWGFAGFAVCWRPTWHHGPSPTPAWRGADPHSYVSSNPSLHVLHHERRSGRAGTARPIDRGRTCNPWPAFPQSMQPQDERPNSANWCRNLWHQLADDR